MSNKENNQEQQLKQLIHEYLKEKAGELNIENRGKDNSFVFLENKTLLTIMTYVLMQLGNRQEGIKETNDESFVIEEILASLDSMITNNKNSFEEIISLLKEEN